MKTLFRLFNNQVPRASLDDLVYVKINRFVGEELLKKMNEARLPTNNKPLPSLFIAQVSIRLSDFLDACLIANGVDEHGNIAVEARYLEAEVIRPTANIYLETWPEMFQAVMSGWGTTLCLEILSAYSREVKPLLQTEQGVPGFRSNIRGFQVNWVYK